MTKWDQLHERFFNHLAALSFDKAKDLLEKDASKFSPEFLPHFHLIVQYERSYHSFGFVNQSKSTTSNARRERTLCECYSELHVTLIQTQSLMKTTDGQDSKEINAMKQFTDGLVTFLALRTNLMKLYEQISNAVKRNEHNVRLETHLNEMTNISQMSTTPLNIPVLNALGRLIKHEIDCFLLLIQTSSYICDYQYMKSVSSLHHMQCILKEWHDNIENQQNTNHRFTLSSSSPLNFFKSPPKPALYTFFSKFHESLIAKFSLYFSELLFEYGGNETRTAMMKTNPDYIARISQFSRRSNVEWLVLILHSNAGERQSHTRFLSNDQTSSWTNGKSFEVIFSYPSKLNANDETTQQILTKVGINYEALASGDRLVHIGDNNQSKTYFLQNVDPRVTLVLVFASARPERDTTISNFLVEFLDSLRGTKQLILLKNPSK